jgi:hypothetical protein
VFAAKFPSLPPVDFYVWQRVRARALAKQRLAMLVSRPCRAQQRDVIRIRAEYGRALGNGVFPDKPQHAKAGGCLEVRAETTGMPL